MLVESPFKIPLSPALFQIDYTGLEIIPKNTKSKCVGKEKMLTILCQLTISFFGLPMGVRTDSKLASHIDSSLAVRFDCLLAILSSVSYFTMLKIYALVIGGFSSITRETFQPYKKKPKANANHKKPLGIEYPFESQNCRFVW